MIAVKLMGGLGNQLFQYSAGRALAQARETELLIDLAWFTTQQDATARSYALANYPIAARPFDADKLSSGWLGLRPKRDAPLAKQLSKAGWKVLRTTSRRHDPALFQAAGDKLYLDGYWQSERYFRSVRDSLLSELTLTAPPDAANAATLAQINDSEAVAVHIRRGDYVSDARSYAHHGVCSIDYYRDAFRYLLERVPRARPFVFSDEPAWARAHLSDWPGVCFVDHNGDHAEQDLRLMQSCRHFIVANSSFSWWGAWLSSAMDKIVVAPRRWFADPAIDEGDLVPETWVRR